MMKVIQQLLVALLLAVTSYAHQDPRGEIHPLFFLGEKGELSLNFRINLGGEEPKNYIAPIAKGSIGEHHQISKTDLDDLIPPKPIGVWIKHKNKSYVFGSEPSHPPQVFELIDNSPKRIELKWSDVKRDFYALERSYAVTDKHFVFLAFFSDEPAELGNLHLYFFNRSDLRLSHHIALGEGAGVFEPKTTDLKVIDDSVYLCWSKNIKDSPPQLILSELSPEGDHKTTVVRREFHWNGGIDMTVFDGKIYVAYHLPDKKTKKSKIHIFTHNP